MIKAKEKYKALFKLVRELKYREFILDVKTALEIKIWQYKKHAVICRQ